MESERFEIGPNLFLQNRKRTLKDLNYSTDKAKLNVSTEGYFTFYHYTNEGNIPNIMTEGLWARREVACPHPPEELIGCHLVEGFIDPLLAWLTDSCSVVIYKNVMGNQREDKE